MHERGEEGRQFSEGKGKFAKSSLEDQRSREVNYWAGGRGTESKGGGKRRAELGFFCVQNKSLNGLLIAANTWE